MSLRRTLPWIHDQVKAITWCCQQVGRGWIDMVLPIRDILWSRDDLTLEELMGPYLFWA